MILLLLAVFLITGAVNLQLPRYGALAAEGALGAGGMALLLQGYTFAILVLLAGTRFWGPRLTARSTMLLALLAAGLASGLVLVAPGLLTLGIARWLQGASVALMMGTGTAWLVVLAGPDRAARWMGATMLTNLELALHGVDRPWVWALWTVAIAATALAFPAVPAHSMRWDAWSSRRSCSS